VTVQAARCPRQRAISTAEVVHLLDAAPGDCQRLPTCEDSAGRKDVSVDPGLTEDPGGQAHEGGALAPPRGMFSDLPWRGRGPGQAWVRRSAPRWLGRAAWLAKPGGGDLPVPPRNEVGGRAQREPDPAFSASWAPIGTTSPEWRPKPLFLPGRFRGTRPDLGRQVESTAARTSWPEHMPADQQGSPGYERGAHRAPREPSGEFSPRAGYRSVGPSRQAPRWRYTSASLDRPQARPGS